ncbi:MAG: GNAT family N-acetyltransferase [Oscillospiraceae bacterium]|jgi:predicted GNAT family acetyltransferase
MEFKTESNCIFSTNEQGKTIAEITFPEVEAGVVDINHTFVDDSLRGQGVAGKLMELAVQALRSSGKKAVCSCSYASKWFEKHPEQADLLK